MGNSSAALTKIELFDCVVIRRPGYAIYNLVRKSWPSRRQPYLIASHGELRCSAT